MKLQFPSLWLIRSEGRNESAENKLNTSAASGQAGARLQKVSVLARNGRQGSAVANGERRYADLEAEAQESRCTAGMV